MSSRRSTGDPPFANASSWFVVHMFLAGCAGSPAPPPQTTSSPAQSAKSASVRTDDFGELHLRDAPSLDGRPRWLTALRPGDRLDYKVTDATGDSRRVSLQVQSVVVRGSGIAALLTPEGDMLNALKPRWIAGDEEGLYQLPIHDVIVDPGLAPLDAEGHVLDTSEPKALWRASPMWAPQRAEAGWQLEELDLNIEGVVSGDRCAQQESKGQHPARWSICASVGVIAREPLDPSDSIGTWRLERVVRSEDSPTQDHSAAARPSPGT